MFIVIDNARNLLITAHCYNIIMLPALGRGFQGLKPVQVHWFTEKLSNKLQ
jgi:hypothetical protein